MRIVIPTVAIFWLLLFMRSGETLSAKPKSLRGSSGDQGPVGGVLAKISPAQVRRKTVTPNHAVIVAGHAVVRLNQLATAGIDFIPVFFIIVLFVGDKLSFHMQTKAMGHGIYSPTNEIKGSPQ
jgi:hypothetical protein